MSLAHDRLRILERRLAGRGAPPEFSDDEVDLLDDTEAAHWAQVEGDRLTKLAQLEAEANHTVRHRNSSHGQ